MLSPPEARISKIVARLRELARLQRKLKRRRFQPRHWLQVLEVRRSPRYH
jgi:hypothetical protein